MEVTDGGGVREWEWAGRYLTEQRDPESGLSYGTRISLSFQTSNVAFGSLQQANPPPLRFGNDPKKKRKRGAGGWWDTTAKGKGPGVKQRGDQ